MRSSLWLIGFFALALASSRVHAQPVPPFYYGGAVAYDPIVGVVSSGAILDAQPVVTNDRKYVTINTRATNTALLALRTFSPGAAVVGVGYVGLDPSAGPAANPSVLARPGMARIANVRP